MSNAYGLPMTGIQAGHENGGGRAGWEASEARECLLGVSETSCETQKEIGRRAHHSTF